MLVHIIADYGFGDLAFAEVVQRIRFYLPDAEPILTPVPAFATLAAGFCIAQLGLNEAPAGTIIYHNVAPREDDEQARVGNAGERLAFARLPTGVRVIGVNAGYAFSFVRDVAELSWAAVAAEGSQFRSRDLFPQAAAAIALGQPDALGDKIEPSDIPDVPSNRIAYIDGYGNLKTTIQYDVSNGSDRANIRLRIGDIEQEATMSDGSFAVEPGQLAFAPGSSGWKNAQGEETRWIELFLRGGNAWESFKRPSVGTQIEII
ncbi:SAM-dependent chlorinase/fluorinase [Coleofasciculus sp. FACHB-64]|uniref:SAM hydrolase/SAM-dependent halogenase family protein n=1 Tax=Cyanophyceae TaxID=3028117 RepID=UPI0016824983|nr:MULTISPECIES: SAM-dependent chlorinase/fluorinase [unclassified Coleofasciculus]MBD1837547.1 SAM-dependent chlorinase/fluorinase [Coleofasciculus sp. FACHB-501]MBD2047200.1 SAM-dependent chlorinase/fluorinase [Coleofasciculus sp. FACHB-64]